MEVYDVQSSSENSNVNSVERKTSTNLIVTILDDENDGDYSEGDLSLREAIALANEREGADTITFENGLNGSVVLSRELRVEDSLTISGLGAENTTIDGNNSSRIFTIDDGNSQSNLDVTIDGLTVTNGRVAEETTYSIGGGILNQENLTILNSTIANNIAEDLSEGAFTSRGGGIYTSGTLEIRDSNITDNSGVFGGGIYSIEATVKLTDTVISNNYAGFVAAGLYGEGTELNLNNSTVTGNQASFAHGGIGLVNSTGDITHSTVSDNIALNASSGGINLNNSTVNLSHSTISGNVAQLGSGGGIDVGNDSTANITNSTIANNSAEENGGGVNAELQSTTNITNSTISGNVASVGAGIYRRPDFLVEFDGSTIAGGVVTISSTIVAGNEDNRDLGGDRIDSNGDNAIGNGDGIDGFVESDLVGTADNPIDLKLEQLQDNGGLTQTIALLEDSPAIDAGNNDNNLATDQRGSRFARTVGNGTDIGAYEVQTIIGDEEIVGTDKSDRLQGTSADDKIHGLGGNDFIRGLGGNDVIYGDAGDDRIFGNKGDDFLDGGDGHDRISGGAGVDTIKDGAGNDILFGGADGDIFLASNSGDDLFHGGGGSDLYIYDLNSGLFDRDRVHDFKQKQDKIALRPVVDGDVNSFDDLDTNNSGTLDSYDERVQILGHSTVIDFSDLFGRDSGSDTITLRANNLNSDNFIFDEAIMGTEFG